MICHQNSVGFAVFEVGDFSCECWCWSCHSVGIRLRSPRGLVRRMVGALGTGRVEFPPRNSGSNGCRVLPLLTSMDFAITLISVFQLDPV